MSHQCFFLRMTIHCSRTFQIGTDNNINSQLDFNLVDATTETIGEHETNVVDLDSTRNSITALDHAVDIINNERSRLGSVQNKLQFIMSNLTSQTQSIEAAVPAPEILAQSAAMLAQASALPQNILLFLR